MLHDYLKACEKIALVCAGQRLSYREIDARSNALANSLVAGGVERGDRVVVFADNTVETVISFWAVLKANAVVSIVNPLTKSDKLAYLLNDCRPAAFITDKHLERVYAAPVRACPHLKQIDRGWHAELGRGARRRPIGTAARARRSTSTSRRSSTPRAPPAIRRA